MMWTEERVAELRDLHARGLNCTEIGHRLNVSRNTIIGKLARLKLHSAGKKPSHRPRPIVSPDVGLPAEEATELPNELPPSHGVALLEAEPHHCRWPIGEPREADFMFCGGGITYGSYCGAHARMAYRRWEARA